MKRLLVLCVVLAFVVAIPLSHSLMAQKDGKVRLCHVTKADDLGVYGHVIEVSINAKNAHCNHGDHDRPVAERKVGDACGWLYAWGPVPCEKI